jgi:hypothetical protein
MKFYRFLSGVGALSLIGAAALSSHPAQAAPAKAALPTLKYATKAWWVNGPYGVTLKIDPSGVAQAEGVVAAKGIMENAITLAGWPPLAPGDYNAMFEQLECHLLWRFKTPYDLDSWRPSVSWATEVHDECNPGYPHATL